MLFLTRSRDTIVIDQYYRNGLSGAWYPSAGESNSAPLARFVGTENSSGCSLVIDISAEGDRDLGGDFRTQVGF